MKLLKRIYVAVLIFFFFAFTVLTSIYFLFFFKPKGTHIVDNFDESKPFDINDTVIINKQKNKDFVILNLADVQMCDMEDLFHQKIIHEEITELVNRVKPDLITLTGDQVWSNESKLSLRALIRWLEEYKIYWAPVFGNHDLDGNATPDYTSTLYENAKYCLYKRGPTNLGCLGNYVINIVEDGKLFKTLYMLNLGTLDEFTEEQLKYVTYVKNGIQEYFKDLKPAMCFTHKPIEKYFDALYKYYYGNAVKIAEFNYPYSDHGYRNNYYDFQVLKSANVNHFVCGHYHKINFSILSENITYTFALKTTETSFIYEDENIYQNGATSFILSDNGTKIVNNFVERGKYEI